MPFYIKFFVQLVYYSSIHSIFIIRFELSIYLFIVTLIVTERASPDRTIMQPSLQVIATQASRAMFAVLLKHTNLVKQALMTANAPNTSIS